MRSIIVTLLVCITPTLCQYGVNTDMRADVTFGEDNDRFDISNLIQEQRHFEEYLARSKRHKFQEDKDNGVPNSSEEASRRSFRYPLHMFARRWDGGFAYHDNMAGEIGHLDDYEKSLAIFQNHKSGRRNLNSRNIMKKPGIYGGYSQYGNGLTGERRYSDGDDALIHIAV